MEKNIAIHVIMSGALRSKRPAQIRSISMWPFKKKVRPRTFEEHLDMLLKTRGTYSPGGVEYPAKRTLRLDVNGKTVLVEEWSSPVGLKSGVSDGK